MSVTEKPTGNVPGAEAVGQPKETQGWFLNFALLWQAQLISAFGDVAYGLALGFWVLEVTKSTAMMSLLMMASTLPRVIIGPFAGVWVDRWNRKKILIWMDVIRGVCIVLVGIAALMGYAQVWMVFVAGVVMSLCGAFFNPAVNSVIPDIVPKSRIVQANSWYAIIFTLSNVVGNAAGGFLYQLLKAPLMFLFDGISYIFAGVSEIFLKVPTTEKKGVEKKFWEDLKEGFSFIWNFKGLRSMVMLGIVANFFANMALVLFMPFFKWTQGLGEEKYGLAMGLMTGGALLGMLFTSVVKISASKRMIIFTFMYLVMGAAFVVFPLMPSFLPMIPLLVIGGFGNAVFNMFVNATVQTTVPSTMRGKVFGLMGTLTQCSTPLAMPVGGILAEFFPTKWVIVAAMVCTGVASIPFLMNPSFHKFIKFDPEKQTLEDIM